MKTDIKRVAIYARKSVKKNETTVSIETQIEECTRAILAKYPDAIIIQYSDIGSGKTTANRPKFLELLRAIDDGKFDCVYVWKLDRFSRSVADFFTIYERLKKVNCQFVALMDGFDTTSTQSTMMMTILAGFAQMERENISDRVSSAFATIEATDGRWLYGKAPFGYRNGKDENGLPTLLPCESEQEIIKDLFRKYVEDNTVSLFSLTGYLRQKYGIRKSASAIRRILSNEKYVYPSALAYTYFKSLGCTLLNPEPEWYKERTKYGIVAVNTKTHEADGKQHVLPPSEWVIHLSNHEGFIPADDFITVQKRLAKNTTKRKAGGPKQHPWKELAGPYMRCSRCGYSVRVVTSKGKERNISCSRKYHFQGGNCGLCFYQVTSDTVRENVGKEIQKVIELYSRHSLSATSDSHSNGQQKVKELEEEKDALISALKVTRDEKTQKTLTKEIERIEKTQEKINSDWFLNTFTNPLDEFLRRLTKKDLFNTIDIDDYNEFVGNIDYFSLTTEEKASLIELLVECIYLYKDGSVAVIFNHNHGLPAEFLEKNQQLKKEIEDNFIQ